MNVAHPPRLRLYALFAAAALALSACTAFASVPVGPSLLTPPPPSVAVQQAIAVCQDMARGGPGTAGKVAQGLTHTQYSADQAGNVQAVDRARTALATTTGNCLQNQFIMGWGADNPEPSVGKYNFATLDARIALIRQTGGTPVITLCCAPDWMKGGKEGSTDWTKLELAPTKEHYGDFAWLAKVVAERYPDVLHYQVWSELRGFWNAALNKWDYQGYTALYNQVYDALKRVNPAIMVGGPYVVMDSGATRAQLSDPSAVQGAWGTLDQRVLDVFTYWLENKHGADFISVDGSSAHKDGTISTDEFSATHKLADLTLWIRSHSDLPVWWSEWYAVPKAGAGWGEDHKAAVVAYALAEMASAGSAAALLWQPQGDLNGCPLGCMWSDTRVAGGGAPTLLAAMWPAMAQWLAAPGHHSVYASPATVKAFAGGNLLLAINTTDQPATATIDGLKVQLNPYGVVVRPGSPTRAK